MLPDLDFRVTGARIAHPVINREQARYVVVRRLVLALLVAAAAGACRHASTTLAPVPRSQPRRHNPIGLGAPWATVVAALGPPAGVPATSPTGDSGTFGTCASGGTYAVTAAPLLRADPLASDEPVVEIDFDACSGPAPSVATAVAQARRFFPDLSGVVHRQSGAVLYSSQPLARLVPAALFFRCQALASSASRLGRFSLRVEPTGWKLATGDCMNDNPPGSPAAG